MKIKDTFRSFFNFFLCVINVSSRCPLLLLLHAFLSYTTTAAVIAAVDAEKYIKLVTMFDGFF